MPSTINIKFPLEDDTILNNALKLNNTTKDAYASDLLFLLLTQKGERYYDIEFGTNLVKFIFEPIDGLTKVDIIEEIKKTVKQYIPNLTIKDILFLTATDDPSISENQVQFRIFFTYDEGSFTDSNELTITF
jgi:phage baseplate assembly protein W